MKKINLLIIIICGLINNNNAQNNPEAFFTSESKSVVIGENIFVSIKKYNATDEQIKNATKKKASQAMSYLDLPIKAKNISLHNREFESMIYCFDKEGKLKWQKSIGYSKFSNASPITTDNKDIYIGEALNNDKAQIQKIDVIGNLVWRIEIDSVETINEIKYFDNKLVALSSFEASEKVESADKKTFSYKSYPVYFHFNVDTKKGAISNNEYQQMCNYMSSLGFDNPYINSEYAYYLFNKDSLVYFNIHNQKSATVVSENMPKECNIKNFCANENSYHYISICENSSKKQGIKIFSDYFNAKKKFDLDLILTNVSNTYPNFYLENMSLNTVVAFVCFDNKVNIFSVDDSGKITNSQTSTLNTNDIITSIGIVNNKLYSVQVNGRQDIGKNGKLSIKFY